MIVTPSSFPRARMVLSQPMTVYHNILLGLSLFALCSMLLLVVVQAEDSPVFSPAFSPVFFDDTTTEPIILNVNGTILDRSGNPVENAYIQFWQCDQFGVYDHPQDSKPDELVSSFNYMGTAMTDENGVYWFKTIRPGIYPERPITHIHWMVWYEGNHILTSQFYFRDDLKGYPFPNSLILDLDYAPDRLSMNSSKTIVVDLGGGSNFGGGGSSSDGRGNLPLTPSQDEGPYYPLVDFFDMPNDLTMTTVVTVNDGDTTNNEDDGEDGEGEVEDNPPLLPQIPDMMMIRKPRNPFDQKYLQRLQNGGDAP